MKLGGMGGTRAVHPLRLRAAFEAPEGSDHCRVQRDFPVQPSTWGWLSVDRCGFTQRCDGLRDQSWGTGTSGQW